MRKIANSLQPNLVKVRIEGPINERMEMLTVNHLNESLGWRTKALVVIINSYGGSLQNALNISAALRNVSRSRHQHPLLRLRRRVLPQQRQPHPRLRHQMLRQTDKLSVLGDMGFVFQGYQADGTKSKLGVSRTALSNNPVSLTTLKNYYQPSSQQFIERAVGREELDLRKEIVESRLEQMKGKGVRREDFQKFISLGLVKPADAVENGLLDGLCNYQQFIGSSLEGVSLNEDRISRQQGVIQLARKFIETSKNE